MMTTRVPTPPDNEAARQKAIHGLRTKRRVLALQLRDTEYTDNKLLSQLVETNARIEGLRYAKDGELDMNPEPTLDQIQERGFDWYWEPWQDDEEDGEDD
jgi:hypothetical protein